MPNRIACRLVAGYLPDYAANRLPTAQPEQVERHLEVCANCRREVEDYRRIVLLMAEAGQEALPAMRSDWQMLAARLDATPEPQRTAAFPAVVHHRLALSLMGAVMLALIGMEVKGAWNREQNRATITLRLPRATRDALPLPAPGSQPESHHQHFARLPALGPDYRSAGLHSWKPIWKPTPGQKQPTPIIRRQRREREADLVPQLLANAARKIDALENAPASQHDLHRFLAALQATRQPVSVRIPASVQVTALAEDRTFLENQVGFQPDGASGGTWMRHTLLEQPNGDRTTEIVAATFRPDRADSFFDLQTCAPSSRHILGDAR